MYGDVNEVVILGRADTVRRALDRLSDYLASRKSPIPLRFRLSQKSKRISP